MILVDIYVPSVDKTYDFYLDESAKIQIIVEEIAEMIGQKERTTLFGHPSGLFLCDRPGQRLLPKEISLRDCGIHSGSSMLLV